MVTLPSLRMLWWWEEPLQNTHPPLAVGENTGAGQLLLPSPSLTLSIELVRALLNEPASMKVDEVRPGPKRSSRLPLRGSSRKAPSARSAGWLSRRVGSWSSLPLFRECCSHRPGFKPQLCHYLALGLQ